MSKLVDLGKKAKNVLSLTKPFSLGLERTKIGIFSFAKEKKQFFLT